MSLFQEKIAYNCAKKEALYKESLGRYALRSMLAGAYLTMSTAAGIVAADTIVKFLLLYQVLYLLSSLVLDLFMF